MSKLIFVLFDFLIASKRTELIGIYFSKGPKASWSKERLAESAGSDL